MKTVPSARPSDAHHNAFVGRQPVFDRQGAIYAYELLFRDGNVNSARVADGTQASARVLNNTLMDIGLETIAGGRLSLINFNRELRLSVYLKILTAYVARSSILVWLSYATGPA